MVFATDLDRTMIYSNRFLTEQNMPNIMAMNDGKGYSFMTKKASELFEQIRNKINVVPCTSRSREQFLRLPMFKNCKYAICDNGATVYINGKIDTQWNMVMRKNLDFCKEEMDNMKSLLEQQDFLDREVTYVDNFFLFTKAKDIHKCSAFIKEHINKDKFYCLISDTKVYYIPNFISKKHALGYVLDKLKDNEVMVAGDSKIDFDMMDYATVQSFIPTHNDSMINLPSQNTEMFHKLGIYAGEKILERVNKIILEKEEKPND